MLHASTEDPRLRGRRRFAEAFGERRHAFGEEIFEVLIVHCIDGSGALGGVPIGHGRSTFWREVLLHGRRSKRRRVIWRLWHGPLGSGKTFLRQADSSRLPGRSDLAKLPE
jgi:hypothetical protein